ncbi:hypothetical protein C5Y93_29430 [Blastopirellula marina]|uniref:POTRA domain-containing protein n=1 Tax=Blastopirellula marina TaxID=124 RepID=A0A2S8GDR5_9BACT|nr:hypothetical protein C5Y93_29430 [Blastopirellula marina]
MHYALRRSTWIFPPHAKDWPTFTRMFPLSRSTQTPSGLLGLGSPAVRQLLLCVAIAAAFVLMMVAGWNHYADQFASREEFLVAPRDIMITPPPAWIHTDILSDIDEKFKLPEKLDLRDRELTNTIASTFAMQPWIRNVQKVVKQYPSKILVEVEYRRPVAAVQVTYSYTDKQGVSWTRDGKVPIDIEGTILPPKDFSETAISQYPQIVIDKKWNDYSAGMQWQDTRVVDAAKIAAELLPYWKDLKLKQILLREEGGSHYELEMADNTRIVWGSAPGKELPQEAPAKHKVQVILQKAAEANLSSNTAQPSLDLRTASSVIGKPDTARR